MPYLMGVDVSTTGVKAIIIDENGSVVCAATTPQTLSTPEPLWSEQDPSDWWKGTVNSIRQVLRETGLLEDEIVALGLTGQMHGLTMLGSDGEVLRPAILWNDQRTGPQCEKIIKQLGLSRLIQITGNTALSGFTAPKVLWVREHEPDVYKRTRQILLPKDYVRFMLTDRYATDKAGASGTLLVDIKKRDWSDEVLDALEIPTGWLPRTHEGPEITGFVTAEAAQLTGLKDGMPVIAGGGDQAAQAVGVGAVQPGIAALTLGTSGVVFASTGQPFIEADGRLHAFCHAVPGAWHLMGVMLSAGGSLHWYRDTFAPEVDFDHLLSPAGGVPAGSEGLLFLPYLTGERTPHADPRARGAFAGLTVRHTRAHLTRAVLEGVAFGLRDSFKLILSAGLTEIKQVRVSGGGAKSPLWRQILADVLDTELITVNTTEGAAYGASLLAGVGVGIWPDVPSACKAAVKPTGLASPHPENVSRYEEIYTQYLELYPALKTISHNLSDLSK